VTICHRSKVLTKLKKSKTHKGRGGGWKKTAKKNEPEGVEFTENQKSKKRMSKQKDAQQQTRKGKGKGKRGNWD